MIYTNTSKLFTLTRVQCKYLSNSLTRQCECFGACKCKCTYIKPSCRWASFHPQTPLSMYP